VRVLCAIRMFTDIATFFSGFKSAVAEVRLIVAGAWNTLVQFGEQRLEGVAPEVVLGTIGLALVVILASWVWWRRRRQAKQRVQTALKAFLAPSPQIKPIPREIIPLRLEKRKDRVTSPPFMLPLLPVVSGPTPAESSPPPPVAPVKLTPELLRRLEWKRFELLVQRDLEARGVRVECTCVGVEGGVDLHLYRGDELQPYGFVQCQAHTSRPITMDQISAFFELMAVPRVEGTFVTTGAFTPGAQAWAQTKGVALIPGDAVVARFNALPAMTRSRILEEVTAGDYLTPTCRSCDGKLVPAGAPSPDIAWVCPRAPRCTYTLPISAPADLRSAILDASRSALRTSGGEWSEKAKV